MLVILIDVDSSSQLSLLALLGVEGGRERLQDRVDSPGRGDGPDVGIDLGLDLCGESGVGGHLEEVDDDENLKDGDGDGDDVEMKKEVLDGLESQWMSSFQRNWKSEDVRGSCRDAKEKALET
jgi:hypothetical protein